MGAHIRGAGTNVITIDGVDYLSGCFHEIIPDRIEAGTFIIMAAAAAKEMKITNIIPQHLESLLSKLQEMGVDMEVDVDSVTIRGGGKLQGVDIKTLPYPGFATDLQQPLSALLTQAEGKSTIKETYIRNGLNIVSNCSGWARISASVRAAVRSKESRRSMATGLLQRICAAAPVW